MERASAAYDLKDVGLGAADSGNSTGWGCGLPAARGRAAVPTQFGFGTRQHFRSCAQRSTAPTPRTEGARMGHPRIRLAKNVGIRGWEECYIELSCGW